MQADLEHGPPSPPSRPFADAGRHPRRCGLALALAAAGLSMAGCAVVDVAGAAVGTAITVTGAVVSTGVELTGKAIGAGIDAVSSNGKKADDSGISIKYTDKPPAPVPAATPVTPPSPSPPPAQPSPVR